MKRVLPRILPIMAGNVLIVACFTSVQACLAYPQFAEYLSNKSGRQIPCSYCHLSDQGPEGQGPGQIGMLSEEQLKLLHTAESPVLNRFGRSLIKRLGYEGIQQSLFQPEKIMQAAGNCDLDNDGLSDAEEMVHGGTDPDNSFSFPVSLSWKHRWVPAVAVVLSLVVGAVLVLGLRCKKN